MTSLSTPGALGLGAICCLLTGCPNPNIYGTPRTTPRGEVSHTVAFEALRISGETTQFEATRRTDGNYSTREVKKDLSFTLPLVPSYQLRYGAADSLDLGFSVRNLSSLAFDAKYNPVRSQSFDLAIDPGVQFFHVSAGSDSTSDGTGSGTTAVSVNVFYFHLPVLLGVNLSESFSLVATPGVVAAVVTGTSSSGGSDRSSLTSQGGVLARFGLGLNARVSPGFALQPEVTAMHAFNDERTMFYLIGLGLNFGKLPVF
jgi:hypothetical protein